MELPETLSESASDFAALPSLEPATRVAAYGGMEGGVGRLGHLGHKSLAHPKGRQESRRLRGAGQDVGQRQMTDVQGSLGTSHEALCRLSLPGNPCPGRHWPRVGRFGGENQASPRRPTSPQRRVAGAAAGGSSWCLSLEPSGCVCLNPGSLEPPGWQVG